MKPFADNEEIRKIQEERDSLIELLNSYNIGSDEKMFIVRRISIITEKLLEKANYAKDIK